jgi:predicted kinase
MKQNDVSPQFIMLIGAPASGKSTWTKKFLNDTDKHYQVLSTDNLITQMAADIGQNYSQGFKQFISPATQQFNNDLTAALKSSENIIMDRTNMSAKARDKILSRVPSHYHKVAVFFQIDRKELDRRLAYRAVVEGKDIPTSVVDSMLSSYNPPTSAEFDEIRKCN